MRRTWLWVAMALALGAGALLVQRARASGVPASPTLYYSGLLTDPAGAPIPDGVTPPVAVSLWDMEMAGNKLCETAVTQFPVQLGRFRVPLVDVVAANRCTDSVHASSEIFVEVSVNGQVMPRTRLGAVPFAIEALHSLPPGTIVAYGGTIPPAGWLVCNGQSLNRADYPSLFGAIGSAFGASSPATFNLPDLRGRFPRGTDNGAGRDPDAATRTASNPGGSAGDAPGTLEADGLGSHAHAFTSGGQSANHTHTVTTGTESADHTHTGSTSANGTNFPSATAPDNVYTTAGSAGSTIHQFPNQVSPGHSHTFTSGGASVTHTHSGTTAATLTDHTHSGTTSAAGVGETRPKNLNVNFMIKY